MSVPGVGRILAMTFLYEIYDIRRFPKVGDFLSYAGLVSCQRNQLFGRKELQTPPWEDEPQPLNGLAGLDENQARRVTSWMISAAVSQPQPPSWGDTGVIASDRIGGHFG